jgi:hypothetical protein
MVANSNIVDNNCTGTGIGTSSSQIVLLRPCKSL